MTLEPRDLITLSVMAIGYITNIAVLKSEVKSLKQQLNGIGGKVNKIDEKVIEQKIEIERIKMRFTDAASK